MAYSRQDTILEIQNEAQNPTGLYDSNVVKRKGRTSDTGELFEDIVCQQLNKHVFDAVLPNPRKQSYIMEGHKKFLTEPSIEITPEVREPVLAKEIYRRIKNIIDIEVPTKSHKKKRDSEGGQIDLLLEQDDGIVMLELKKGNSDERAIRAILEIYTYYKWVDLEKFKLEYSCSAVSRGILTEKGSPYFRKLMSQSVQSALIEFGVDIYVFEENHDKSIAISKVQPCS